MKIINFLDLKITEVNSSEEFNSATSNDSDMVEMEGEYFALSSVRPRKISWRANLGNLDNVYDFIKSSKLRDNMIKWSKELHQGGFKIEANENLSKHEYIVWLSLYKSIIREKERGNIKLNEEWFDQKQALELKVGAVFIYKNNELLGGNIFTYGEKFTVGYGVIQKVDTNNWNLGALVDFECVKKAHEMGYKVVSFGKDTNLYGHHLSSGLFAYKCRLGLTPSPYEKDGYVTTKFLSFDKFHFPIVFVEKTQDGKNKIQVLYKDEEPNIKEFSPKGVDLVETRKV